MKLLQKSRQNIQLLIHRRDHHGQQIQGKWIELLRETRDGESQAIMHYPLSSSRWAAGTKPASVRVQAGQGALREACGPLVGPEEGQLWELSWLGQRWPANSPPGCVYRDAGWLRDGGPKFRSTGLNWKGVSIGKRAFADVTKSPRPPGRSLSLWMTILKETESVRPGEKGRLHRRASLEPAGWEEVGLLETWAPGAAADSPPEDSPWEMTRSVVGSQPVPGSSHAAQATMDCMCEKVLRQMLSIAK